jgi:hypothetical protein
MESSRNFFIQLMGLTLILLIVNNSIANGHIFNSPKRLNDFQSKHDLMQIIKKVNMHNSNDWGRLGTTRFGKRSSFYSSEDLLGNNQNVESTENNVDYDTVDSKRALILSKIKFLLEELI